MCWKSQKCLRIITWELGLLLPKRWWYQQAQLRSIYTSIPSMDNKQEEVEVMVQ